MNPKSRYNTKIDIWSIGCIFYELVSGKLFIKNGKTELNALNSILERLGDPPEELVLEHMKNLEIDPEKFPYKKGPRKNATEGLEFIDTNALDLINKCLTYDTSRRISASEALNHPYFAKYYEGEHDLVFEGFMDDGFEKDNA